MLCFFFFLRVVALGWQIWETHAVCLSEEEEWLRRVAVTLMELNKKSCKIKKSVVFNPAERNRCTVCG